VLIRIPRGPLALAAGLALLAGPAAAQPAPSSPPPAPRAAEESGPDAEAAHVTAPVVLDGEMLFRVRGTSAFPAEERARRIAERIEEAARAGSIAPEAVQAVPGDGVTTVVAGDRTLLLVTEADARLEMLERPLLARAYAERIQRALQAFRQAREPAALRRGAARAVGATAAFAAALFGVWWVFRRLQSRFTRRYEERIRALQFQSFEILRANRIRDAARALVGALRAAAVAVLAYLWLQTVLASFPGTRPLAGQLLAFALEPLRRVGGGLVAELPDLVFLVVLFFLLRWLVGLARLFFEAVERRQVTLSGFEPDWAVPTYRILRLAIVAFGLVIAYPYIPGSRSPAFQGISILLGLMVSIGSSSFLSNIIAGYSMIYRRAFRVGDRIAVGELLGDVTEIRLQVTHLRSVKNEEIVVPNATLLGNSVVNYSALARSHGLILHTTVGIGYETPWRQVEAMLLMAAERTAGLGREPAPFVLQKSLGDFCVVYELNAPCDAPATMATLYTRLHQNILDVFNEYGVQIMTPAYEGDPQEPKLVRKDQWWSAPARKGEEHAGAKRASATGD
jgi:small-conductance mechanosensitive channel